MDRRACIRAKRLSTPPPPPSGICAMIALLVLAYSTDGLDPGSSVRHVFFYVLPVEVIGGCMMELDLGKAS